MKSETYNGWTNYETWAVALWMDNDEGSQTYWNETAEALYSEAEADETFTQAERATMQLADAIKDQHEDNAPDVLDGTVFADLLNAALSEVNWHEIAKHYVDAVIEEQAAK